MPVYIGVDFHTRTQTVCWCEPGDGEIHEQELDHDDPESVLMFYRRFPGAVVGIESVGYTGWFHRLMDALGNELQVGDARAIRKKARRRQKNDRRDARQILELLLRDDFPVVHRRSPASQEVLGLLRYRHRLVKMQTMLKNGLQAVAMSEGLRLKARLWTETGQERFQGLPLEAAGAWQRETSLKMLEELGKQIERIEAELKRRVASDAQAQLLQTHPGVGLLTSLAVVHLLIPTKRFGRTKQVAAYCGYDPCEDSSGDRKRFGHISKQGSRLIRFLLGQAALNAMAEDEDLRGFYYRLVAHKHKHPGVAVTATARKLLIRLFVMLRDQVDYAEFRRRGRDARVPGSELSPPPAVPAELIGPHASPQGESEAVFMGQCSNR